MSVKLCFMVSIASFAMATPSFAAGSAQCARQALSSPQENCPAPLRIEIMSSLDFSRLALAPGQSGAAQLDPVAGVKQVSGGVYDMGGLMLRGSAHISGEPNALVRIDLPPRVLLRSSTGESIELVNLQIDLPPLSRLDGAGQLQFSFGGRLVVSGRISGQLRGSIPISVDYE
jgi:hypothetical protein